MKIYVGMSGGVDSSLTAALLKEQVNKIQDDKAVTAWSIDGFVVIDIRSTEDYNKQHIVGATNVPLNGLHLSSLNPDVDMVVYSPNQQDIDKAVSVLSSKNIRNVYTLHNTMDELQQAGYKLTDAK